MKLTVYEQEHQEALAHAFQSRERFTLTGAGISADFQAEVLNQAPCWFNPGRVEVSVELTQIGNPTMAGKWTGEGLPPVGTVCEWKEKTGFQWVAATVLFITDKSVVLQRSDGFEWQMMTARTVFRTFRTPEQIAEEKREADIEELRVLLSNVACDDYQAAVAMIDAGYRKKDNAEGWK